MNTNPKHAQDEEGLSQEPEVDPGASGQPMVHQDPFRRVLFGQASDPLFPPHPEPEEVSEPVLSDLALKDVPQAEAEGDRSGIPLLRWLLLAALVIVALGILFFRR